MPEPLQESNFSIIPETKAGVLKQKEKKELENAIRSELLQLGSTFTKKDIAGFLSLVETSKDLGELKQELEKTVESGDKKEAITIILHLAEQIRSGALDSIRKLESEILKERAKREEISEAHLKEFYSHRFDFVKKLEESKLGKNLITDGIGITVGAIDSIVIILKILLNLVVDGFRLVASPKKAYKEYKKNYLKSE